jgi:hypothetical protein
MDFLKAQSAIPNNLGIASPCELSGKYKKAPFYCKIFEVFHVFSVGGGGYGIV